MTQVILVTKSTGECERFETSFNLLIRFFAILMGRNEGDHEASIIKVEEARQKLDKHIISGTGRKDLELTYCTEVSKIN